MKKIYFLASAITLFCVNESSAQWCTGRGPSECKTKEGMLNYKKDQCYNQKKCDEVWAKANGQISPRKNLEEIKQTQENQFTNLNLQRELEKFFLFLKKFHELHPKFRLNKNTPDVLYTKQIRALFDQIELKS
jgi:hypothetical protein